MLKLLKNTLPKNHTLNDFKCFGPAAVEDGLFKDTMLCDLGCFNENGKSSNKYYFACVTESTIDGKWYAYFEYGKTGSNTVGFQFIECSSKDEAHKEYEKQLHTKNDKRGEWVDHPQLGRILKAKQGKDCYLVRQLASRSVGLPNAKDISNAKTTVVSSANKAVNFDSVADKLIKDLSIATQDYTRNSMIGDTVPSMDAIIDARKIIDLAVKLINSNKVKQNELEELTNMLYSKIPKKKNKHDSWVLDADKITTWTDDLDAFENAVQTSNQTSSSYISNLDFMLSTVDPKSEIGKFLYDWAPKATLNRHGVGSMKIANIWSISRTNKIVSVAKTIKKTDGLNALNQPKKRVDILDSDDTIYRDSGTSMLFHGTRSVNVGGILKETLKLPAQLRGVSTNGAMFGPGIYFADDWKKSHGYTSSCDSYWSRGSGGIGSRKSFMFIGDVVLGNSYVPSGSGNYSSKIDDKNYHSVYAMGSKSSVANNEFIVFNKDRNYLRYLVEYSV